MSATPVNDALVNLVANLGTQRDKSAATTYAAPFWPDDALLNAYRGAWMPRKIVDVPALDATRNWRNWQAKGVDITGIEAEEKRLGVRAAVLKTLTRARLFGGAAIFIGTGDADLMQPLDPARIGRGGLRYLTPLNRRQLSVSAIGLDPTTPFFGMPERYTLSSSTGAVDIHPSRLVIMAGAEHPDPELQSGQNYGWGDSVLTACMEVVKSSDSTLANIVSLVFESKVDVFSIPHFMENLGSADYRSRMIERFTLAAMTKGINGALVIDAEEKYEQKSASFATLPEILMGVVQLVCGAADIPATRLLGQSPGGLNSTGQADLQNYYARIGALQSMQLTPAMEILDECLIRSALGDRPPEVFYDWASLWQTTAEERASIGKIAAETIKTLRETQLYPDDALSRASVNMLTELNVMPGLETAIAESGPVDEDEETAAFGARETTEPNEGADQ